jgi:hypothetical protein
MIRILAVAFAALASGALLATGTGAWPIRPGLVGLALMLAGAFLVRRRWARLEATGGEPGSPERALWHALAATAMVAGHLFASLWRIGPAMELHTDFVHAMAIDNWTLVLGAAVSYLVARDPEPRRDERDEHFAAAGVRAGYVSCAVLSIVLSVILGFGDRPPVGLLSHAMIAHLLISSVMLSLMVCYAVQLRLYWSGHRHAAAVA